MNKIQDISLVVDNAYKLANMIRSDQYKEILYYEFHEEVDASEIWNCHQGLEEYVNYSKELYDIFICECYPDEIPANIHVLIKVAGEWFLAKSCGSNYYHGFGPQGIYELRKACKAQNVTAFCKIEDIDNWIKKNFPSNYLTTNIIANKKPELYEFESIVRDITHLSIDIQRRPQNYNSKSEEEIRDCFLNALNIHYQGLGNAEAKNYEGKSDILIKTSNGQNEFIFELKKWTGISCVAKTIEQIKGYLAWHNNFGVIIIFYDQPNMTKSLQKTLDFLSKNYLNCKHKSGNSEFRFDVPLKQDKDKYINLYLRFVNMYLEQK